MRCEQVRAFLHAPSRHGFRSAGSLRVRLRPAERSPENRPYSDAKSRTQSTVISVRQCDVCAPAPRPAAAPAPRRPRPEHGEIAGRERRAGAERK